MLLDSVLICIVAARGDPLKFVMEFVKSLSTSSADTVKCMAFSPFSHILDINSNMHPFSSVIYFSLSFLERKHDCNIWPLTIHELSEQLALFFWSCETFVCLLVSMRTCVRNNQVQINWKKKQETNFKIMDPARIFISRK